jgi:hypothetical protein
MQISAEPENLQRRYLLFPENGCHQDDYDADGKGRVCDIERGPVVTAYRKIDEVHNLSVQYPVDEVPDSTAEDEGESERIIGPLYEKGDDEDDCRNRYDDKKTAAETFEGTERRSGVPYVHDMEERENLDGIIRGEGVYDQIFCDLIERDNREDDERNRQGPFHYLPAIA